MKLIFPPAVAFFYPCDLDGDLFKRKPPSAKNASDKIYLATHHHHYCHTKCDFFLWLIRISFAWRCFFHPTSAWMMAFGATIFLSPWHTLIRKRKKYNSRIRFLWAKAPKENRNIFRSSYFPAVILIKWASTWIKMNFCVKIKPKNARRISGVWKIKKQAEKQRKMANSLQGARQIKRWFLSNQTSSGRNVIFFTMSAIKRIQTEGNERTFFVNFSNQIHSRTKFSRPIGYTKKELWLHSYRLQSNSKLQLASKPIDISVLTFLLRQEWLPGAVLSISSRWADHLNQLTRKSCCRWSALKRRFMCRLS